MKIGNTLVVAAAIALAPLASHAVQIRSEYTQISGPTWSVDFTLVNDGAPASITGFSIFFPVEQFSNLILSGSPLGWDSLLLQGDAGLPAPGFLDSFKIDPTSPLTAGQSLDGFQVRFRLTGPGAPGPLAFDINDPAFNVVASGFTTVSAIPEPESVLLLALGLAGIAGMRSRRSAATASA